MSRAVLPLVSPNAEARAVERAIVLSLPLSIDVLTAVKVLGIKRKTLYTLAERDQIPHYRIGRTLMFPVADLIVWMAKRRACDVQTSLDNFQARYALVAPRAEDRREEELSHADEESRTAQA